MLKIVKNVLKPICVIWSYVYTPKFAGKMGILLDVAYTLWVSRTYRQCDGIISRGTFITGTKYISLSEGAHICKGARLETHDHFLGVNYTPEIVIGKKCRIGHGTHITSIIGVKIGDFTNIGDRCLISDNNHGNFAKDSYTYNNHPTIPDVFLLSEMERPLNSKGPVIIEHSCQIGEGSVILTGVMSNMNSIVSSNSFVRDNVPPYSIVAGNPAKVIRSFSN